jgi:alkylation response protein AidB-like acyl-CoA dehydrogenase
MTDLAALAAEHATAGERDRRLAQPVVDAMAEAGVFRLLVPESVGGLEVHPAELVETVEAVARGDAAAGWVAAILATSGIMLGYFTEDVAREILATPTTRLGGVFAPRGRAVPEGDAFRVTGRWPFSSGCEHCDWLMGGAVVEGDPAPSLFLARRAEVEIVDTWDVGGLKATGSHDIAMDGVLVPAGRAASLFTDTPVAPGRLYAFPVFGLLAVAIAGVALGTARGALDDIVALGAKVPTAGSRSLAERPTIQAELARAEAALRAARAGLLTAIGEAWDHAEGGLSDAHRLGLRLGATHATQAAAEVVTAAYRLGGGTALYASSPLERRLRDVNAATQHMLVAPAIYELGGRLLFGLPTDTAQL